jgi:ABC-2 type transport system ATP-binding protein
MSSPIIRTEQLVKHFGEVQALKGVDLEVQKGTVLGLLGPNGAGKTTAVRILTTLLAPTGGRAEVDGLDVVRDAEELRFRIGLAGQSAAVDENLTGLENLELVGRLYHLPKAEARRRGGEVLERFGLAEAAGRPAKTYSGGMRRRLDLAASLVGRIDVWDFVRELQADGTTLLLTTQYLDEADVLADRIAVIDVGTVIAEGTSDELKARIGGEVLELHVEDRANLKNVADVLAGIGSGPPTIDDEAGVVRIPVGQNGFDALRDSVRRLDETRTWVADIALHRPTLDDVFLSLTGRVAEDGSAADGEAPHGRGRSRRSKKEEA